ncbi:hypothetical protein AACH06_01740 [Ideonella sp. DXS29W]|uniref:Uncharacterized protein n=1 Tax=Ideonella lacteola TaxID=2984193 RepID=A0ABU9BHU7_9BURK
MPIKFTDSTPLVSSDSHTLPLGPLLRRPQRLIDTSSSFAGIYLRPSHANGGVVPASGALCCSPDIWIANQAPIDQPGTLIQPDSHSVSSSSNIENGMSNFIYVRGYNNGSASQTRPVTLHYAPAAVVQWPCQWRDNIVRTASGSTTSLLTAAAQSFGVTEQPFVWHDPPPPPPGSDHYGLIAQVSDTDEPPAPRTIHHVLDMAAWMTHGLNCGWKNSTHVPAPLGTSFAYSTLLSIPHGLHAPGNTFLLWIAPRRYTGWSVQFSCSELDSDGRPVTLGLQPVPISADGQIIGLVVTLEPGFHARLSVTLFSNGHRQLPGASLPLMCSYQASGTHAEQAFARGLVDPVFMRAVNDGLRGTRQNLGTTPTAYVGLGGYTWTNPITS